MSNNNTNYDYIRSQIKIPLKYNDLNRIIPNLDIEMMSYEDNYFTFDLPVPFGKATDEGRLFIYPIKMKDYNKFMSATQCLMLEKPKTVDPSLGKDKIREFLAMTNLDYLIYTLNQENGPQYAYWLNTIIELCLHVQNQVKCVTCGEKISYDEYIKLLNESKKENEDNTNPVSVTCPHCHNQSDFMPIIRYNTDSSTGRKILIIDNVEINDVDYERLRKIILFQNLPDFRVDTFVDENLKKDYEKRMEIKTNKAGVATLEDKINAVSVFFHLIDESQIYEMTIRKFLKKFTTMDDLMMWQFQMSSLYSGFSSIKAKDINNWIYKPEVDMYGDIYQDFDAYTRKVNS